MEDGPRLINLTSSNHALGPKQQREAGTSPKKCLKFFSFEYGWSQLLISVCYLICNAIGWETGHGRMKPITDQYNTYIYIYT